MTKQICTSILLLLFLFSCSEKKIEKLIPDDYKSWKLLTETKLNYYVPGHESRYRIPYINPIGENVEISKNSEGKNVYNYKKGTIIVKEIYKTLELKEGESPIMLTVMVKEPDHPNAQGGWVWVVKDMESNKEIQFKSDMCVRCHAGANGPHPYADKNPNSEFRDYVFYSYKK